jgi:succinate dehydrogenase/fumarate reductase flavoprotein subunit
MMHWMKHEGVSSLVDHFREEGIDLRKNPVEFMPYELILGGGVRFNEKGETCVKGLYAAGDELFGGGGISCAATMGWIAGANAANHGKRSAVGESEEITSKFEEWKQLVDQIRNRQVGPNWKEVNIALQHIMNDHVGLVRSESMLKAGLTYLKRLKDKSCKAMVAKNSHELMHCLEVLNLLDLGELVFMGALERKETRRLHRRVDPPFTNPLMEKVIVIKKIADKPIIEWKKINP